MRILRNLKSYDLGAQLNRYVAEARGNAAVIFAVAALPIALAAGVAIDYAVVLQQQTLMQNATDSTALAIARDASNMSAADVAANARSMVTASLANARIANVTVAGTYDPATYRTTVSANGTIATGLLSIMGYPAVTLGRTSIAQAEQVSTNELTMTTKRWPVCLMVTADSSNHSLFASGPGKTIGAKDYPAASTISINDCMLQVNTANWDAVETDQPNAKIIGTNSEFCFHGGYIHNVKNHGTVTTTVDGVTPSNTYATPTGVAKDEIASPGVWDSGCPVFADPLQNVPSPLAAAACATSTSLSINKTTTLTPGRICGNVSITGGTVTFSPGVYQIDGALSIAGGGTVVKAEGVTIYLSGPAANFDMSGGTASLTPAIDASLGNLSGVALYVNNTTGKIACVLADGNPNGPGGAASSACINTISGGQLTYSGLAYFRYLAFRVSGSGQVTGHGASLIADYVATTDTAKLTITGIANAATVSQLLMMQNSQAGYQTTSTVSKTSQRVARLVM